MMAKHNCAICNAEIGLLSEQKLADGNYICRKVCAKKCFRLLDLVAATLTDVTDHIAQIEWGTKVWNQVFLPLKSTKVKEEKLRQIYGLKTHVAYVSPSTGLIAFLEPRYKFFVFGKTDYACVFRVADLVTYEYASEQVKNSEGKEETKHYCWFGFKDTKGLCSFRMELGSRNDFDNIETDFNELFGIQKTIGNMFKNAKREINAAKSVFGAVKSAMDGDISEQQVTDTFDALNAVEMGDRTEWIEKANAALANVK